MIDIESPREEDSSEELELPVDDLLQESPEFIEESDGGALFLLEDEPEEQQFDDNLADQISQNRLKIIASDLLDAIDRDKQARKKRDQQYEEGIRRTGLGDDAPGGAQFNGASKAVHPVLAESCVDFAARAIKELFPAKGPVRMESDGLLPPEVEAQTNALSKCLNEQFTRKIVEYRSVFEQKLTQLPLGGSQFTKFWFDSTKQRICAEFVPVDDIFLPFYANSFYDAERVTHRQYLTQFEFENRVDSGMYRDIKILSVLDPERSASATATDKIEGKELDGYNEDGARVVYEVYTWLSLKEDEISQGVRAPYIVSIDEHEQEIVSVYRNWDPTDPTRQKQEWIVEDTFIPWRGAYGVGLPHLIGGLSAAATGALRALLDSAHINNAPTLLKLKGSRISGQSQQVAVTQIAEIEGPVGVDDIRKYLMPMPFNAPSPVLLQLLGWLTDAAKGVVSTASEKIADATSNTPVGTVQALIEQGAVIFSSIHARLHFSQAKAFEIVLRLLKQYQPGELQKYGLTPESVDHLNVNPVSDPHIFSEAQRFAQMQGVMQLAASDPEMAQRYNKLELHRAMLTMMKVPNIDRFLPPPPPPPQPVDPAQEMILFVQNKPVVTDPQQDHFSHIVVHMNYLRDPMCGRNPVMVPITARVMDHLREHIGYFFAQRLMMSVQQSMMEHQQQSMMLSQQGLPVSPPIAPETTMAQTSSQLVQQDIDIAQEALNILEDTAEFIRQNGPQDANMAAVKWQTEIQKMDIERQRDKDMMEASLKAQQEQRRAEVEQLRLMLDERKREFDEYISQMDIESKERIEELRQSIEVSNNESDNRQKQLTELLKNEDDNRTRLIVEEMKLAMNQLSESLTKTKEEKTEDESPQLKQIEKILADIERTKADDRLAVIMDGLRETINSARAPRKTIPIRDEEGNMIGARSELE